MQGTVSKWTKYGYGFVVSAGNTYFLHHTDLPEGAPRDLNEGDVIQFEPMTTDKGMACRKVRLPPPEPVRPTDVDY